MDEVQSAVLDALGSSRRRAILYVLRDGPLSLDVLATVVGCAVQTVRDEVAELTGAGLVDVGRFGIVPVVETRTAGLQAAMWEIARLRPHG